MSDDILNRIDDVIAGHRQRFDPLGGDVWDEDRVDRWGDGMRVRPARTSTGEESEPGEAAVTWTTNHDPRSIGCRNCDSWLPQRVALCGPCGELPPCAATRWAAVWDDTAVCLLPVGHSREHESVEGRTWQDRVYVAPTAESPVEALRPERVAELFGVPPELLVDAGGYRPCMERLAPPVDADPDPDPAPTRNPLSDLYAALRARARRGGTKP